MAGNGAGGQDPSGAVNDDVFYAALEAAATARSALKKGGEPDTDRASLLLIDEFRKGILGRVTLDELPAKV